MDKPFLDDPFAGPLPAPAPAPANPGRCDLCDRPRQVTQAGTNDFPVWLCGTCRHRRERSQNCREMTGRGRRGY